MGVKGYTKIAILMSVLLVVPLIFLILQPDDDSTAVNVIYSMVALIYLAILISISIIKCCFRCHVMKECDKKETGSASCCISFWFPCCSQYELIDETAKQHDSRIDEEIVQLCVEIPELANQTSLEVYNSVSKFEI